MPVRPAKQALELFRAASTTLAQTFAAAAAEEKGLFCILAALLQKLQLSCALASSNSAGNLILQTFLGKKAEGSKRS